MERKGISAITILALAVIVIGLVFAATRLNNNSITSSGSTSCTQDSDCIYISGCDFCQNVNYFNSHPKIPCPVRINPTGNSCACQNNQCTVSTSTSSSATASSATATINTITPCNEQGQPISVSGTVTSIMPPPPPNAGANPAAPFPRSDPGGYPGSGSASSEATLGTG